MRKMKRGRASAWMLALFAGLIMACGLAPVSGHAQTVKGSIDGSVVDTTGAVVPGAEVVVRDPSTGATARTVTDATGLFHLALLGIGDYNLTVTKEGFRKISLTGVVVNSAATTSVGALKLEVGQASTTVEVTAAAPLLHATESQISNNLTASTISELPGVMGNEGLDNLAILLPGVVASRDNNFSNTNGMGFSVNGIRGRNNDQQIDGQNNNDNSVTGPAIFLSNPDFVQEYQVTTSNFGIEYNRNSGSVVNINTKSGTNNWHGDAFVSENSWKTTTLSNTQKAFEGLTQVPKFNDVFSGISGGGPIKKDKLFVFAGFDNENLPGTSNFSTGSFTPTPAGIQTLQGCFPNSASVAMLAKYGPYGVTGGNPTPMSNLTTKSYTAANGSECDVEMAGVARTLSDSFKQYDLITRVDWQGDKDKVYGRFIRQTTNNANVFGNQAVGYPASVPGFGLDIGLDWTRSLSATMVNEGRLSYGRTVATFGTNTIGNTIPGLSGIGSGLASITMPSGYANLGPPNNFPQGRTVNTYQFQDNWSWFRGKHQFKAGTNITYQRSPNVFLPNYNGTWTFGTMQSFFEDAPSSIAITVGSPTLDFREHDNFFYLGDDFKATSNLTLNLGVSYAYFGQPANLFYNYDKAHETNSTPFFDPNLPLADRIFPHLDAPKKNLAPNVGFAYSPHWGGKLTGNGKTVIRGGYRLTYDPAFYNIYLNIASAAPQVLAQSLSGDSATANPLLADPLGYNNRAQLASYLTFGVQDPRNLVRTTVAPNFRNDHVHSWSLGVQREINPHAVFETRYIGNHGANLFQSINGNPEIDGLAATFPQFLNGATPCSDPVVPRAAGRLMCDSYLLRIRTNSGVSDYNGWQNEFRANNLFNQLTLRTSYTFSKTTDNASDIFSTFGGGTTNAFSQNPLDYVSGEHSLSGIDIPNAWTLEFFEQLPFFRNQPGLKGHILGGWALSGSYILTSGQTYTPVQFALNTFSGGAANDFPFDATFIGTYESSRPFISNSKSPATNVGMFAGDACAYFGGSPLCNLNPNLLLDFNSLNTTGDAKAIDFSAAHYIVNGGTADAYYNTPWGTANRNSLRDAKTNSGNFSIQKDTRISERFKVRFDVNFLNVFNHPNFSSVDPFLDDAGLTSEETGFALPSLYPGGVRNIKFDLKLFF
jgi:Carboxypeptidase regulatory-like domain